MSDGRPAAASGPVTDTQGLPVFSDGEFFMPVPVVFHGVT